MKSYMFLFPYSFYEGGAGLKKHLGRLIWRLIPKKIMSRLVGRFAKHRLSKHMIPLYIKYFDIDCTPVKKTVDEFDSLLDFFVREYHMDARPIDQQIDTVISPVDGTISQMGEINRTSLLQVKGISYTLDELLGENQEKINKFTNGYFVTIYLSPRDYHRIHMPLLGEIKEMTYISGELYPVNEVGLKYIPRLFARNERLISYIHAGEREICMIKVGATNVGSIKVAYDSEITTNRRTRKKLTHKEYHPAYPLEKGDELGRFEFGSTVILLFPPEQIDWMVKTESGTRVQMGQAIARILK